MSRTPQSLAEALGGAEQRGADWYALCPAHDDQTPSLAITAKDGTLLWVCRAGCSQEAVTAALKARGLLLAKAPRLPNTADAARKQKARIVATYDYTDEAGNLIGQVCRLEPKAFRQRRPDGRGGWLWKMDGLKLPLYNLQAVAAAPPDQTIIIVEGEKDVESLRSLGFIATTNPGGAGKWRRNHSESLRGRSIVICPDSDSPGRSHAGSVASSLSGIAKYTRIAPISEPHKDISDWIAAGATKQAIRALTRLDAPVVAVSAVPATIVVKTSPADWYRHLIPNDKNKPRAILANAIIALRESPYFYRSIGFDTFAQRVVILKPTPWKSQPGVAWRDYDDSLLAEWLQGKDIFVSSALAAEAVQTIAKENAFDSLQDYISGLNWDGTPRLHSIASIYFGADPSTTANQYLAWAAIGAVARGMQPGAQVDSVPVLEGPQGARKSTAIAEWFGRPWFRDSLPALESKDAALQLCGVWCIELSELDAVNSRRAELERVKAFISRRSDSYRPPYGRRAEDFHRRTVFMGTTNEKAYLKDSTGNRRWWPIECGKIDPEAISRDRDQLWAEAMRAYTDGKLWWPDSTEHSLQLTGQIAEDQEIRRTPDPWEDRVASWLLGKDETTVQEILEGAIKVEAGRWTQYESNRIARILQALGFLKTRVRKSGVRTYVYRNSEFEAKIGDWPESRP